MTPKSTPHRSGAPWVGFDDSTGETWLFEVGFFGSNWKCIFGEGCAGIEHEPDVAGQRGCCSYGAHFADDADLARVMKVASALPASVWQKHDILDGRSDVDGDSDDDQQRVVDLLTTTDDDGDRLTRVVGGACVFLNDPGFAGGGGCALHLAASAAEIDPLHWKPEVCWQLPIRVEHHLDDNDHQTHMVRQWLRRDWGESGDDLGWWCAEAPEAYVGTRTVASYLRSEVAALAGDDIADALIEHVNQKGELGVETPVGLIRPADAQAEDREAAALNP